MRLCSELERGCFCLLNRVGVGACYYDVYNNISHVIRYLLWPCSVVQLLVSERVYCET